MSNYVLELCDVTKKYEEVSATLGDFDNLDELIEGGADVSFYKKKAQSIVENLKKVKADLIASQNSIKETADEYQKLKKQVISAQKQYAEAEESYKAVENSQKDERTAILKELAEAEKALMVLGYTKAEAQTALKGVSPTATLEEMVSSALRKMALRF